MKSQKKHLIACIIVSTVFLTAARAEVLSESQQKEWTVFQEQIPENVQRLSINLRYSPSDSTLYNSYQSSVKSTALTEEEQTSDYKEQINFGSAIDGCIYSVLIRGADELIFLNYEGKKIRKVRIVRTKQGGEREILKEGYLFLNSQVEIPFTIPGQQLGLNTNESLPGTFSLNIYGNEPYSHQGSFSTTVKGSLTGSSIIEGGNLNVSITYRESLSDNDRYVNLSIRPFDAQVQSDNASGRFMDVLNLRSAKLLVEKMKSDSSEIVLAIISGDINIQQSQKEEKYLGINKPLPSFARIDLIRRKLFTWEELRKKAGRRYIVFIFGDLKRGLSDYYDRGRQTTELNLDETIIFDILNRDLKNPPLVIFVLRRFFISDFYEKWLGQEPEFYTIADYSNPMDIQFAYLSREYPPFFRRPSSNEETLRSQLNLPNDKVSILLIDGKGKLVNIDTDAGQTLSENLTKINELISSKK